MFDRHQAYLDLSKTNDRDIVERGSGKARIRGARPMLITNEERH